MADDQLQHQRFELKYQLPPATALAVRDFVRGYLEPDGFAAGRPGFSYAIHSLYLDSAALQLYRATINGDRNRFKVRVRYYDDAPGSPAFLEIKRRANDCIRKQRACVRRECVAAILAGAWPVPAQLVHPSAAQVHALDAFCRLLREFDLRPCAHVAYEREAWMNRGDNAVRVTLDRHVRCEPRFESRLSMTMQRPAFLFQPRVVLELKFTNRFPNWCGDLVRCFGLSRSSAAKYVDGVEAVGANFFMAAANLKTSALA